MSAPAKVPKAEAVDRITAYRKQHMTLAEIAEALGLSRARISQIVRTFQIPRGNYTRKCPHCGLDTVRRSC